MSLKLVFVLLALAGLFGIALGYTLRWLVALGRKGSMELEIKQMMLDAKEEAKRVKEKAEKEGQQHASQLEKEVKEKERHLIKREELLDNRQQDLDKEGEMCIRDRIKEIREKTEAIQEKKEAELERVAGLSLEDAKGELIKAIERDHEEDILVRIQKLESQGKERLEQKAKDILVTSIHRYGNAVHTDVMATTVSLPNDEIKGKIIGKEGRNIKAFERASGVDVIVDESPGTITISSFDPARRQIARVALENLIIDGRIQPAKIEEAVEKAKEDINKIMKEKGEQAAYEAGVINVLDPRVVAIMGRLHFRTSYGQNVLWHSVEMAHIAGLIAGEVGANIQVAKAGAFVHDLGKAVDHEVQGTHVEIGRRILQKFGTDEEIVKAMQAHHEEYPYETPESMIVQVADAISGGRPGARRDSVENYLKRLGDLEVIAKSFDGVEKVYAISAGREVRVFVTPEEISDLEAHQLAKNIAKRIEDELGYPGEIKIAVFRETKAIEYAR